VILPALSMVWHTYKKVYFFIQMQQPYDVFYAVAEQIGGEWKATFV
jgi:hypothetical protein